MHVYNNVIWIQNYLWCDEISFRRIKLRSVAVTGRGSNRKLGDSQKMFSFKKKKNKATPPSTGKV